MILVVCIATAAAASLFGIRILSRARSGPKDRAPGDDNPLKNESTPHAPKRDPEGFSGAVGDVFMSRYGDDVLLVGAVVFTEGAPWGVLFVGSSANDKGVFLRPGSLEGAALLTRVPDLARALGLDVPSTLEWENHAYMRVRRVPVNARAAGEGVPILSSSVVVHEFDGEGGRVALVIASGPDRYLYTGARLRPDEFELIAPK